MSEPVHIAAIDAVSNAVRLSVGARLFRAGYRTRAHGTLPPATGRERFRAAPLQRRDFQKKPRRPSGISRIDDEFGVTRYRPWPRALRASADRQVFVRRIKQKSGIKLEVISAGEESRLGREAGLAALADARACVCEAGLPAAGRARIRQDVASPRPPPMLSAPEFGAARQFGLETARRRLARDEHRRWHRTRRCSGMTRPARAQLTGFADPHAPVPNAASTASLPSRDSSPALITSSFIPDFCLMAAHKHLAVRASHVALVATARYRVTPNSSINSRKCRKAFAAF